MILAFTGTRDINPDIQRKINEFFDILDRRKAAKPLLITGACIGVDAYVASCGKFRGYPVYSIIHYNRKTVDPNWRRKCFGYSLMPEGTDYRARDTRMVEICDRLIGFPKDPNVEEQRSGTWMTIRIARSMRKDIRIY